MKTMTRFLTSLGTGVLVAGLAAFANPASAQASVVSQAARTAAAGAPVTAAALPLESTGQNPWNASLETGKSLQKTRSIGDDDDDRGGGRDRRWRRDSHGHWYLMFGFGGGVPAYSYDRRYYQQRRWERERERRHWREERRERWERERHDRGRWHRDWRGRGHHGDDD